MQEVPRNLVTASTDFHRSYAVLVDQKLAPFQLTNSHWCVFKRLFYMEPCTLEALAQAHGLKCRSMAARLKKLVELGFAEVDRNKTGKKSILHVTEEGRVAFSSIRLLLDDLNQVVFQGVPREEQIAGALTFDAMRKNLEQATP